ncbi:hypothetical protein [Sphingobacterium lumbrici]|uniref:hypothetical protein n=1 Tax=Sphingobacterium lumbrici TaxID=2559600 RepID=UPI001129AB61|nr:hypothetical protein [Sphingobacterium lumbrici]
MKALTSFILLIFTIVVGNHIHAKTITGKIVDEAKVPIAKVEVRNTTKITLFFCSESVCFLFLKASMSSLHSV